jgi:tetratricopeptide (TPR) repeat protein
VARALAFEAAQTASRGGATKDRAAQVARMAEELSQKVGHPHAIGLSLWASGVCAYLIGNWKHAAELCEKAGEVLRDRCTGVTWELTIAHRFMLSALLYLGELAEVSRRVPGLLSAALEQGNLFAATDLRTRLNLIWLAADDPDKARSEVIEALKTWPHEGFHLQHYSSLLALVQIELYTGDGEVAWKHIEGQWAALEHSMLLRFQVLRVEAMHLRARALLAKSPTSNDLDDVRIAEQLARKIEKEKISWVKPFAMLIRATVAQRRNQSEQAATLLSQAIQGFENSGMNLYAAATRRRLGETLADDKGRELITQADAWMTAQRIKAPESITRLLVPGF